MTDEELLKAAEAALNYKATCRSEEKQMIQSSIAASLLVIARNSLPVIDHVVVDNPPIKPATPDAISGNRIT